MLVCETLVYSLMHKVLVTTMLPAQSEWDSFVKLIVSTIIKYSKVYRYYDSDIQIYSN